MKTLTDKLMILLLCCTLIGSKENMAFTVIAFLSAAAVSSVCQLCGSRTVSITIQTAFACLCFIRVEFLYFLPLVLYDTIRDKGYIPAAASIFAIASSAFSSQKLPVMLIAAIMLVSSVLQQRTASLDRLEREFIRTRDNSAEMNMLLSEKNRQLRNNQFNEVHLATLKERNRIAREIHDNVGHLLSRSIIQLGALRLIKDENVRDEGLASLNDTLNNAMNSIRESVHDLHDESIDLKAVLEESVKPLENKGFSVHRDFSFTRNMPVNIKLTFAGIVKEGVNNIIKHSSGNSAKIILREHPAFYQLMIEDNGSCSEKHSSGGIGLTNMRDRINEHGGIIRITSGKEGFRIFITVKKQEGN